jgi:hypothetical protein
VDAKESVLDPTTRGLVISAAALALAKARTRSFGSSKRIAFSSILGEIHSNLIFISDSMFRRVDDCEPRITRKPGGQSHVVSIDGGSDCGISDKASAMGFVSLLKALDHLATPGQIFCVLELALNLGNTPTAANFKMKHVLALLSIKLFFKGTARRRRPAASGAGRPAS